MAPRRLRATAYLSLEFTNTSVTRAGFRLLSFLLLSALWLGGCTLLHPHRITNPNLPPGFKEQQRAARRAQKNSLRASQNDAKTRKEAKDQEAIGGTDSPTPGAAPSATAAASDEQPTRVGADKSTVKYDKHGLMKKPKLKQRRYYKPAPKPFQPWQRIRNLFKKNPKRHGKSAPAPRPAEPKAPVSPTPAPATNGLTP